MHISKQISIHSLCRLRLACEKGEGQSFSCHATSPYLLSFTPLSCMQDHQPMFFFVGRDTMTTVLDLAQFFFCVKIIAIACWQVVYIKWLRRPRSFTPSGVRQMVTKPTIISRRCGNCGLAAGGWRLRLRMTVIGLTIYVKSVFARQKSIKILNERLWRSVIRIQINQQRKGTERRGS